MTFNAETHGLGDAIDAAWTAGDGEECNRLEIRLWLDGPDAPEGRVSGPARELALEMNRMKIRRSIELAERLPNGSYRALPGRAHLPYLEAADEVAALLIP